MVVAAASSPAPAASSMPSITTPKHLGLIVTGVTCLVLLTLAYTIPPTYPKTEHGSSCAAFCYGDGTGCSSDRWGSLPCRRGIVNECGNTAGQSPIDLVDMDGGSGCGENEEEEEEEEAENYRTSWQATFNDGTCTFDTLTSTISDHAAKTSYPSSSTGVCDLPSVTLSHLDGTYELLQLHFHTRSEHTINGNRYDGEVHLVHRSTVENGQFAVIGIMLDSSLDDDNEILEPILGAFESASSRTLQMCSSSSSVTPDNGNNLHNGEPGEANEVYHGELDLSEDDLAWTAYQLVPSGEDDDAGNNAATADVYAYFGSLTTPPCSSIVQWIVFGTPLYISANQHSRLRSLVTNHVAWPSCNGQSAASRDGDTYRPIQKLAGRELLHHCKVTIAKG